MASFNALQEADRRRAEEYLAKLTRAYEQELRRIGRTAAANFTRHAGGHPVTAAAGDAPAWHVPDPDEVLDVKRAVAQMDARTGNTRLAIAEASVQGTLATYGIDFNLSNPLLQGVIAKMGNKITHITESTRADVMSAVQKGYDEGLSIRDTGKLITATMNSIAKARAETIARTEMTAGTSGGSWAAARLVNDASPEEAVLRKIWVATDDDRTREAHAEAADTYGEGSGIGLDQPFIVDGEEMQYPGDDGSPENTVNCRCTVAYEQGRGANAIAASAAPGARYRSAHATTPATPSRGASVALTASHVPPSSVIRLRRLAGHLTD